MELDSSATYFFSGIGSFLGSGSAGSLAGPGIGLIVSFPGSVGTGGGVFADGMSAGLLQPAIASARAPISAMTSFLYMTDLLM